MKKMFMALLFTGSSCVLFAQVEQNNQNQHANNDMLKTNTEYSAYGVTAPSSVNMYFYRDNPTATNVRWQQEGQWWKAAYLQNNRNIYTYYNAAGKNYTVALPVLQNQVPEEVVTRAINMYGDMIYDITAMRAGNGQDVYTVRLLENEQLKTERITMDGSKLNDTQWEEMNSQRLKQNNLNQNMNHNQ